MRTLEIHSCPSERRITWIAHDLRSGRAAEPIVCAREIAKKTVWGKLAKQDIDKYGIDMNRKKTIHRHVIASKVRELRAVPANVKQNSLLQRQRYVEQAMHLINKKHWTWDDDQDSEDDWKYAYAQRDPPVPIIITKTRHDDETGKIEYEVSSSDIWFTEVDGKYERVSNSVLPQEKPCERENELRSAGQPRPRKSTSSPTALSDSQESCTEGKLDKTA